jgi:hypothetical protein
LWDCCVHAIPQFKLATTHLTLKITHMDLAAPVCVETVSPQVEINANLNPVTIAAPVHPVG